MDFFGDRRLWYAIVAVVVVVVVAAVFWPQKETMEPHFVPATTNPPAATPATPPTTPPKQ